MPRSSPPPASPRPELIALIEEVKDRPDDTLVCGVLADWLEEHGDPRGEFFRLQSRQPVVPEYDDDPDIPALSDREVELLKLHGKLWLGPLYRLREPRPWYAIEDPGTNPDESRAWEIRRGMVRLHIQVRRFLTDKFQSLLGSETWAWVETLRLKGVTPNSIRAVAESPLLASIKRLDLEQFLITPDTIEPLVESRYLKRLTALVIGGKGDRSNTSPGDIAIAKLVTSALLSQLKYLNLGYSGLGPDSAIQLASSPNSANLTGLDLSNNWIDDDGFTALAQSPHLSKLEDLGVFSVGLTDTGMQALAAAHSLDNLTVINLARNHDISDVGAQALARSKKLPKLRSVTIYANRIENAGWNALARRFKKGLHG